MVRKYTGHCAFCTKERHEVKHLIAGAEFIYICDQCIKDAYEICRDLDIKAAARKAALEEMAKEARDLDLD